jgi:hypothetical protein
MTTIASLPIHIFSDIRDYVSYPISQVTYQQLQNDGRSWMSFCNASTDQNEIKNWFGRYFLNKNYSVAYFSFHVVETHLSELKTDYQPISQFVVDIAKNSKISIFLRIPSNEEDLWPRGKERKGINVYKPVGINPTNVHGMLWEAFKNPLPLIIFSKLKYLALTSCYWYPLENLDISHLHLPRYWTFNEGCQSFGNVLDINLSGSNIKDVSLLKNAIRINLSLCYNVTDVSMLKNVKELDISFCSNITDISALGNVAKLSIHHCGKLDNSQVLPINSQVRELTFSSDHVTFILNLNKPEFRRKGIYYNLSDNPSQALFQSLNKVFTDTELVGPLNVKFPNHIHEITNLSNIHTLAIQRFFDVHEISNLVSLTSLTLDTVWLFPKISGCPSLRYLQLRNISNPIISISIPLEILTFELYPAISSMNNSRKIDILNIYGIVKHLKVISWYSSKVNVCLSSSAVGCVEKISTYNAECIISNNN